LAASRPVCLADPKRGIEGALDILHALERLHNVVEEGVGGVTDLLLLPVGEGIG
jgi:hypothetical protein